MSKDYCGGCQDRHYNDDMDHLYLCDACTTILYQGKGEIETLTTKGNDLKASLIDLISEFEGVLLQRGDPKEIVDGFLADYRDSAQVNQND